MKEKTNKEEKRNVLAGVDMPWNESDQTCDSTGKYI
jgi:hypothetical protein